MPSDTVMVVEGVSNVATPAVTTRAKRRHEPTDSAPRKLRPHVQRNVDDGKAAVDPGGTDIDASQLPQLPGATIWGEWLVDRVWYRGVVMPDGIHYADGEMESVEAVADAGRRLRLADDEQANSTEAQAMASPAPAPVMPSPATSPAQEPEPASNLQTLPIHPRAPRGRLRHNKHAGEGLSPDAERQVRRQLQIVLKNPEELVSPCGTEISVRADDSDMGTWFLKLSLHEGPLSGGTFLAWLRFPTDFPDAAPHFAMLTPTCLFTEESTGIHGTGSVCLEHTFPHTMGSREQWRQIWTDRFHRSMIPWLLTLAVCIESASTTPAEFAWIRQRDGAELRATGTKNTIGMTVDELAAACLHDAQTCHQHNAHSELAAVVALFEANS